MRRLYCELFRAVILCTIVFVSYVLIVRLLFPVELGVYHRAYFTKRDLLSSKGDSCVVLLGGSNVIYGFNSGMLSDSLGMSVINAGLTRQMGLKFMLDFVSRYLRSGDVLMICPEYEHFFGTIAYGEDRTLEPLYCLDPEVRRDFSLHQYIGMLSGITGILRQELHLLFMSDSLPVSEHHFNVYGDHDSHWSEPGLPIGLPAMKNFSEINHPFLDCYASAVRALRSRGVVVVILPPSYAVSAYDLVRDHIEVIRVELSMRDVDYMLDPIEFVYPDSLFYDTHYHLGYAGVLSRTSRVLTYLRPLVHP